MFKKIIKKAVTYKNLELILFAIIILISYSVLVYFVNFSNRKFWAILSLLLLLAPSLIICLSIYYSSQNVQSKKTNSLLYKYVFLAIVSDIALIIFGSSYGPSSEVAIGKIQLFAKIISSPELLAGIGVAIPTIYIWIREGEDKDKERISSNYQTWLKDFSSIKNFPSFTDRLTIQLLLDQDIFNLIKHIEIFSIFQKKFGDFGLKSNINLNEALKWQIFFTNLIKKIEPGEFWDIINSSGFNNFYFIDFSTFLNSSEDMQIDIQSIGVEQVKNFIYSTFPDDIFENDSNLSFSYCIFNEKKKADIGHLNLSPKLYYIKNEVSYEIVKMK